MFRFWSKKREKLPDSSMAAVVSGDMIPIEETKDAVFSQKMLGDGIAILPKSEWIVDGTVSMVYPTLHALGIINEDGLEILIHIGIDTVALNGEGFQCYVRQGQKVKTGDKLMRFDKKVMEKKKADLTTMMIRTPKGAAQREEKPLWLPTKRRWMKKGKGSVNDEIKQRSTGFQWFPQRVFVGRRYGCQSV